MTRNILDDHPASYRLPEVKRPLGEAKERHLTYSNPFDAWCCGTGEDFERALPHACRCKHVYPSVHVTSRVPTTVTFDKHLSLAKPRRRCIYWSLVRLTFRCDIPIVFYKVNTKYITISQNTTKIIVLCCTICFTTTCFGPFLWAIFRLCTPGLESHVSYIQIYYIDDEISVIIIQL